MSLWCDEKYLRLLSPQLDRFQKRGPRLYNFRCPFCGDSASNKIKARGYLFPKQQVFVFKCHNCGLALPFGAFLKRLDRSLYDEYLLEAFDRVSPPTETVPLDVLKPSRVLHTMPDVHVLSSPNLPASLQRVATYVDGRHLPPTALARLYATERAQTWLTPLVGPEKSAAVRDGVPYLVLPLRVASGGWYGAQLRPIDRKEYLTFRWAHDELNRVFGLDVWNPDALTYCVEGPLDSLCVPNAIAFCGSDLETGIDRLHEAGLALDNYVLVWDNEPRNTQIVKLMKRAIDRGATVFVWPKGLPKDLNDCVAAGHDVAHLLSAHTYTGLRADLEFRQWTTRNR